MGQVSVTLNNRTYRLACNDGEEARLTLLARDVKTRVENLAREFGQPGDERILLMAAVLLADELMDLREAHEAMLSAAADVLREAASSADSGKTNSAKMEAAKPTGSNSEPSPSQPSPSQPSPQDAAKPPTRAPNQGAAGGSAHPALPQTPVKAAKS